MKTYKQFINEQEQLDEGFVEMMTFAWDVVWNSFILSARATHGQPFIAQGIVSMWALATFGTVHVIQNRIEKHWTWPRDKKAVEEFMKNFKSDPELNKVVKVLQSNPTFVALTKKVEDELETMNKISKELRNWKRRKVKPTPAEEKQLQKDNKNTKARMKKAQRSAERMVKNIINKDLKHLKGIELSKAIQVSSGPDGKQMFKDSKIAQAIWGLIKKK